MTNVKLDRVSSLARELRGAVKERLPTPLRDGVGNLVRRRPMQVIEDLSELPAVLARVEEAFRASEDDGRRELETFCVAPPRNLPDDPRSDAYRQAQLALYCRISGRSGYSVANEVSPFDLATAKRAGFPYSTGSLRVVGDQLIGLGFLCKVLALRPPARVLEFGPGWGNTTLALLQTGVHVTAVEVDARFVELLRHKCQPVSESLELVHTDMLSFESQQTFDVALFFESFHHCEDHVALLSRLERWVRPGGALVFAGEPIGDFPYPWGVRLDGQSVWSMRKYGWLELGFDSAYFFRMLEEHGWKAERLRSGAISPLTDVIVARRSA